MRLTGRPLALWIGLALVAMCAFVLAVAGTGEAGVGMLIRATARSAVALFLLAFVARPLAYLWRSPFAKALLRERRYLGVSAAVSMALHLAGIGWRALAFPDEFSLEPTTLIFGGGAYVLLGAMAATSSNAAVRRLGRDRWRLLHLVGMWWVWFVFTVSFLPEEATPAEARPLYVAITAACLGAAGLRLAVRLKIRRHTPAAA